MYCLVSWLVVPCTVLDRSFLKGRKIEIVLVTGWDKRLQ